MASGVLIGAAVVIGSQAPLWWIVREIGNGNSFHSMSTKVDQAAGMVAVQADCSIEAAVTLLEARAAAAQRSVEEIAEAVVEGSIWFD